MDYTAVYLALATCGGIGLLVTALAIPLAKGKINRNQWYGFRTPRTLSSDEIWFPANRLAGGNMIVAGVLVMITAVTLFFLKGLLPVPATVLTMASVTFLAIVASVVKSFLALRKM
ncbi:MAG: SdpI family protein [Acidobacteria bacterium]|nr:SdpI family protein [Acidobacteriota bacterium]